VRFRAERDVLADGVAWAARTLPSRPPVPVLAGLVLHAESDALVLSSFDYEVSTRVLVPADIQTAGTVVVPGRLLSDICRALPGAPVEVQLDGTRVRITCGRSSFAVPIMPAEDYPQLPTMPEQVGSVPADVFAGAITQVAIAAGKDDTLPMLTGMRMEIEGTQVTLAATDRYRLAMREFTWEPLQKALTAAVLIPARTMADMAKALSGGSGNSAVQIALAEGGTGEGMIGFESTGRRTTTRLLDGEFPKYRGLLPNEASCIATVSTAELIEAVRRVALVADRNAPIHLAFNESEVTLRAGAGDEANATETLGCAVDGDGLEIAFNPAFLLDGLSAVGEASTNFRFTESNKPAVLEGVEAGSSYRYLLMPIRLTG